MNFMSKLRILFKGRFSRCSRMPLLPDSPTASAVTPLLLYPPTPLPPYPLTSVRGQASTELVLMMPVFILMIGIALSVGYMCWQGIKVQQAANFAARIQGQERIGGGRDPGSINYENGLVGIADQVSVSGASGVKTGAIPGLYGRYRAAVQRLFNSGEQIKLFVPAPKLGINTDQVRVVRVLKPPKILNFQMKPILLDGEAYGGEDPRMYGLPRWGNSFYQSQIKE